MGRCVVKASVEERLRRRFESAEKQGLWVVANGHSEESALRHRISKGDVAQPFRGCYARTTHLASLGLRQKARITLRTLGRCHDDWVFCSYSAALLHGLWVANALLDRVHIVAPSTHRRSTSSLRRHAVALRCEDVAVSQGVRVTSLERTLMDCLCGTGLDQGLAIIDSALHWNLIGAPVLERYLETCGVGRRGIRQARRTLALADGRSGSALESFARAKMVKLGFAAPELQVELFDPLEPDNPKFGDFGWLLDSPRPIIGEADGLGKYRGGHAGKAMADSVGGVIRELSWERRREAHLNLTDARIVRFSYGDVADEAYFERLLTAAGVPRAE